MTTKRTESEAQEWLKLLNANYSVVYEAGKVCVMREAVDQVYGRRMLERFSFADFRKYFQNRRLKVGDGDNARSIDVGSYWLNHHKRRQYSRVVFKPDGAAKDEFNLWRGFTVEPKRGNCSLIVEHLRTVLCRRNHALYRYVFAWIAHMVQHPGTQPEVAVAIRGPRGSGKSLPVREIGKLLGQHFIHVSDSRHLIGNFNSHLHDAVLVFADEAIGSKTGESTLKMLITEPRIPIERKGMDVTFVDNCVHLILASNDEWIVPAGIDERRFLVLDADDSVVGNREYFRALVDQMDNGGRAALLYELLHHDLSQVDLRDVPATEALREQKLLSMRPHERWWFDKLMTGRVLPNDGYWRTEVSRSELLEDYTDSLHKSREVKNSTPTELGMFLSKLVPRLGEARKATLGVAGRRYHWVLPSLAECRAHFDRITKSQHPWPKEEQQ